MAALNVHKELSVVVEIIFETIFPALGRLLSYLVLELFGQVVCYTTGYFLVKVATLGKRPIKYIPASSNEAQESGLILIGLLFWALFITYSVLVLWQ